MRTGTLACAAFAACIALALPLAVAGEIYKWTDAEGNVHYGDRPSGAANEERVPISSAPTDPARVQAMVEARRETRAAERGARAAEREGEASPEEQRAAEEERARKCADARERLQRFVTSRRLYREDENGERVYLDEAESQAMRDRAQEQVLEFCS